MVIDVGVSSCARPKLLEVALRSFHANIRTNHELRVIILEDVVDDQSRQREGEKWFLNNYMLFDDLRYSFRKLTYVYCYRDLLAHIVSPVFFRLEDDVKFNGPFDIDTWINCLLYSNDICQIVMRRDNHIKPSGGFCSIATGLHHTQRMTDVVLNGSEDGACHESKILTPSMNKLGYKSIVSGAIGHPEYVHIGKKLGCNKGNYNEF